MDIENPITYTSATEQLQPKTRREYKAKALPAQDTKRQSELSVIVRSEPCVLSAGIKGMRKTNTMEGKGGS
jgi:hypothetical protein